MKTPSKIITAGSSADQRQRLLELFHKLHRRPPRHTAELTSWANSEAGRNAIIAEAKGDPRRKHNG